MWKHTFECSERSVMLWVCFSSNSSENYKWFLIESFRKISAVLKRVKDGCGNY